jgi:hypothetical protein
MKPVVLTEQQALIVMRLLDAAVRAGGLEAAALALPVAEEIENQLMSKEEPNG